MTVFDRCSFVREGVRCALVRGHAGECRGVAGSAEDALLALKKAANGGIIDQGDRRKNSGKPPMHLLPWDALAMVAWVLQFGACKYAARNWEKGLSWTDCIRAIAAHSGKLLCGEWYDDESACPHVAHIACNALFICAMSARGTGIDDLPDNANEPEGPGYPVGVWVQSDAQAAACARELAKKDNALPPPT